nr:hypothetical protein [uncultured organism]
MLRKICLLIFAISFVFTMGCATIVKSEKMPVRFTGGLGQGETKLSMPDGQYTISNGQTTVLVTRSREDIPISVTCNNETREGVLKTRYDAFAGVLGNIVFGGPIGIGIDAFGNKTYDPPSNYNLAPLCFEGKPAAVAVETVPTSRKPSAK